MDSMAVRSGSRCPLLEAGCCLESCHTGSCNVPPGAMVYRRLGSFVESLDEDDSVLEEEMLTTNIVVLRY